MALLNVFIDLILHVDKYLTSIVQAYGIWTYAILFFIIFIETGFVVTPILPGDSLIFLSGAIAESGNLKIELLFVILSVAAILGDTVNYWIGHFAGPKIFTKKNSRFFKREYLERTHGFFEKHGGKTIIMARFIPVIRTFAPFVAGIVNMSYLRFITYNVLGGVMWVAIFVFGGYYFGNLPVVQENLTLAIYAIIGISIVPAIIEFLSLRKKR